MNSPGFSRFQFWLGPVSLVLAWWVWVSYASAHPAAWLNADAYYFPMLYRDLFEQSYPLSGWSLATAPVFFPDLLIFFPLALLSNAVLAIYLYPLVWSLLWVLSLYYAWRTVQETDPGRDQRLQSLGLLFALGGVLFLLAVTVESHLTPSLYSLVHPHGSSLCLIWSAAFWWRYLHTAQWKSLAGLALIALLTIPSDRLFWPLWVAPLAALSLVLLLHPFYRRRWQQLLTALGAVYLAARTGQAALDWLRGAGYLYFGQLKIKREQLDAGYIASLVRLPAQAWRDSHPIEIILAVLVISIAAWYLLRLCRSIVLQGPVFAGNGQTKKYFALLWSGSLAATIGASSMVGYVYYEGDLWHARYLSGLFSLSLPLLVWSGWNVRLPRLLLALFSSGLSILILIFGLDYAARQKLPWRAEHLYLDPVARCLDDNKERWQIQDGLSDYWNAKSVTLFSKQGIRAHQITGDVNPYLWVNNFWWYYGSSSKPRYTFILPRRLEEQALREKFGPPHAIADCAGQAVWLYPDTPDSRLAGFLSPAVLDLWRSTIGR
ncbi:MAG: hypothetical protein KDK39_07765 [Leptospiraceae bacterium]|nr:hypothetical protein [Leptospiraceae bacterium]